MIRDPVAIAAAIAAITALAFWLDRRVPFLSKIGASLLVIIFGAILSNAGLVPPDSPVYGAITGPATSLAIVWLLLAVNIRDLRRVGPSMLGAFLIGVVGTALGAFAGALLFSGAFGGDTWRLAGVFTGTYSGGSLNFVAVGRAVELPDALFAGATAADAVTTAIWLGFTLLLPLVLGRFFPKPVPGTVADRIREEEGGGADGGPATETGGGAGDGGGGRGAAPPEDDGEEHEHPFFAPAGISVLDIAILVATAFLLLMAADAVAGLTPGIPGILWLTTFALLLGHLPVYRRVTGAMQLGNFALHLFFAVIGIHSRIAEILEVGVEVFWFTLVVVAIHGVVAYGVGRLARFDVGTVSVASQAAVGGPSSALAVAVSREWPALILPGIVVGLLGYAVGNYVGVGVALLVQGLGVGL